MRLKAEALIFEQGRSGRQAWSLPEADCPDFTADLSSVVKREEALGLPAVSELEVVRHFTALAHKNYSIDGGFYPLGSCTMKYNPKINEVLAKLPSFSNAHPLQEEDQVQASLAVLAELEQQLSELTGFDRFTFQPSAGAQGELVGLLVIRQYHRLRGDLKRNKILVPDAAHGTNPASASSAGFITVEIPSDDQGNMDIEALKKELGDDVAGLMLTNPNTLGLFETNIREIADLVHEAGGLLYYDGANANAIVGLLRPGDMGFDVCHLNLHKTFSTPHGGGGPGSGPVGVKDFLAPYLPTPLVKSTDDGNYAWDYDLPDSIGKVHAFSGNFAICLRALIYIRALGGEGLQAVAKHAVLNANYIRVKLQEHWKVAVDRICMHEVVFSGKKQKQQYAVSTLDVAKRLIDLGYHPPTMYFPLIVEEALMIEPTETETKETLDAFIAAMKQIAKEIETDPELLHQSPRQQAIGRPDEAKAARNPILSYSQLAESQAKD